MRAVRLPVCGFCSSQVESCSVSQRRPHTQGAWLWTLTSSKQLLRQSGDLETALPGWLREGFPLGIETVIENCGIFPVTAADTAAVEASRIYGRNGFPSLRHKNYLSFYESVDLAQADLDRSVGLGFVEKFGSLEEVRRTCGSRAWRAW